MKTSEARFRLGGERRQVTALFYDIVGSTEILIRTDPETFFKSIKDLHQTAEGIVSGHGGFLHQRLGDGGCCFFGYPELSEDAAESAVRAGLELAHATTARRSKSLVPFRLRIGIATSFVVFSLDRDEVVGAAPILASRLQAEAEPGSVLVADSTYQLTKSKFDYSFIGEESLKGFDKSIILWRPEAKPLHSGIASASTKRSQPMIGRGRELATLVDAWKAALDGNGGSIAIVGEAGVGKSKLVAEFREGTANDGATSLALQCNKRLESEPLHPFVDFLETVIDTGTLKAGNSRLLHEALRTAGMEVDVRTVETISTFIAGRPNSTPGNIRTVDPAGSAFRKEVIDAAIEILASKASAGPATIVFEDVHWADTMSLELLDRLSLAVTTLPMLVVQTSRAPRADAVAMQIALAGLPPAETKDLVKSIWREAPSGLSDFILGQCDGMPLYAEELAHFFRARHAQGQSVAAWRELLENGGVSSLNDLLSSRLAGVGSARRTAQFASVIGREFNTSLLSNLLERRSKDELADDLAILASHGIIEPTSDLGDAYQFRHVLIQEAAYGSLLRSDRRRIHQRIARLLIEGTAPPLPDAIAAWQCAEAGRHIDAARFALMAAEACILRSAMKEAVLSLDLCTKEMTNVSSRHPDRRELLLNLLQLQGVVTTALDGEGSESARRIYSQAMQRLRRRPANTKQAYFPIYWGWWFTAPDIRSQQSRARILVDDLKVVEDSETKLQSYHCGWATSFHAGEHGFCLDCVQKGLDLYDPERAVRNRAFFGGHDAKVCGLGESALSNLLLDRPGASQEAIDQSLEWATATDHAGSMVHALYYAIVLRSCQGRYDDVQAFGERMLTLADKHGLVASRARANMYCGWAEMMTSPSMHAVQRFQDGLANHLQSGTDDNLSIHSDMHSQVLQHSGRPEEALLTIRNAISLGHKSGQWFWLPELYRRKANLRRALGDRQTSIRTDLVRAIRIADRQGAVWLSRRARQDLDGLQ